MTTTDSWDAAAGAGPRAPRVLLFSDDVGTRDQVQLAVGRQIAPGAPDIDWVQAATHDGVVERVSNEHFDLLILDGEAAKSGGMGLCRQLKDEVFECPRVLLLIAREQDAWLASWCNADAVAAQPVDPIALQRTVADLLSGQVVA